MLTVRYCTYDLIWLPSMAADSKSSKCHLRTSQSDSNLESRAATSWMPTSWMRWIPTSDDLLAAAERKILSYLKSPYEGYFVTLQPEAGVSRPESHKASHRIWTVTLNTKDPISPIPLVMVHGFGGGVGMWALNLDELASRRPLYAFDLLGFGRSSRPSFSTNAEIAEQQFVDSIEAWRKEQGLKDFILLGHSLGAFIAASYCLRFPQYVRHLIMVDPWGLAERPSEKDAHQFSAPLWIRTAAAMLQPFNPLAGLRVAGPWGPRLVGRFRPDLQRKFANLIQEENAIFDYIYHCNAQTPSGEVAFKHMTVPYGWAKNAMLKRMYKIEDKVPISFVYGSRSWIDHTVAYLVKENRTNSRTEVLLIHGAGHHVYADRPHEFNEAINRICNQVDRDEL
ncbi:(Lyso)-N-acylphosphatidylethanolamine lipase-like isoform X2 [Paramacrobiotus metropolitanus]|uniref:(Lyso)-N-acylphosphatidylethanolamine lipase-like isoform X2 n=2 Tax=Paramacrobiotus metropolitanus TaxID=2943436 RepID=UPI0024458EE7|nr:(Lyso)-N-acylphosphatidylethanolamine lipase-like isoform X2 [Paramacrobiotus metropolitanus]